MGRVFFGLLVGLCGTVQASCFLNVLLPPSVVRVIGTYSSEARVVVLGPRSLTMQLGSLTSAKITLFDQAMASKDPSDVALHGVQTLFGNRVLPKKNVAKLFLDLEGELDRLYFAESSPVRYLKNVYNLLTPRGRAAFKISADALTRRDIEVPGNGLGNFLKFLQNECPDEVEFSEGFFVLRKTESLCVSSVLRRVAVRQKGNAVLHYTR